MTNGTSVALASYLLGSHRAASYAVAAIVLGAGGPALFWTTVVNNPNAGLGSSWLGILMTGAAIVLSVRSMHLANGRAEKATAVGSGFVAGLGVVSMIPPLIAVLSYVFTGGG